MDSTFLCPQLYKLKLINETRFSCPKSISVKKVTSFRRVCLSKIHSIISQCACATIFLFPQKGQHRYTRQIATTTIYYLKDSIGVQHQSLLKILLTKFIKYKDIGLIIVQILLRYLLCIIILASHVSCNLFL